MTWNIKGIKRLGLIPLPWPKQPRPKVWPTRRSWLLGAFLFVFLAVFAGMLYALDDLGHSAPSFPVCDGYQEGYLAGMLSDDSASIAFFLVRQYGHVTDADVVCFIPGDAKIRGHFTREGDATRKF